MSVSRNQGWLKPVVHTPLGTKDSGSNDQYKLIRVDVSYRLEQLPYEVIHIGQIVASMS